MGREEAITQEKLKKIAELRKAKIEPFAYKFDKKNNSAEIKEKYSKLKPDERTKDSVKVAGRVMTVRDLGKLAFATIQDKSGTIQIVLQEGETADKKWNLFKSYIDAGDIVGVEGTIFRTKRGEISILVKDLELLTKAIRALPEKWHGIQNDEERLRKRYLDIIMNPEIKELFIKKSKFWQTIRNFLLEKGFLEIETPVLESSAGGAAATPFKTHHNAMDMDVFLRISMGELWQKKLMVAGYEKTFEIGRQFRNEGMDMEHLQDYSQMEFYWAYADFKDGMKLTEEMYKKVAMEVLGTLKFKTHGYDVDLGKKWEMYDYESLIKDKTGINIYKADEKQIKKKLDELKIEYDKKIDKWRAVDILWKFCRKQLTGPGFLINQPVEVSPLAKRSREDNKKVEQFQIIIAGSELGNGYSELNDPIDQEERFLEQAKNKERGDAESMEHDKGFVEALEYGMPPTCGFGVSERLFGYLVDKPLRECVVFPLMKPEAEIKNEIKILEKAIKEVKEDERIKAIVEKIPSTKKETKVKPAKKGKKK
ncbi:MAG: lysine--tRNA ligase [Nanoarchaeota archaeon]